MIAPRYRVLLIEDDRSGVRLVREAIADQSSASVDLKVVRSLAEAMNRLRAESFDAVLIDLGFPGSDGLATFEAVHAALPALCTIVLSGNTDLQIALLALNRGAQDCVQKREIQRGFLVRTIQYAVERQRNQDALRASEHLNREIVETIGEGIWIIDEHCQTTFVNGAIVEMLGCEDRSEILSRPVLDFVRPGEVDAAKKRWKAMKDLQRERFEFTLLRKDRGTLRVLVCVTSLSRHERRFSGALVTITDVSARARAEEWLVRSEMAFRLAQKVAHIGHWQWDPGTGEAAWSDEVYRIMEVAVGEEEASYEFFLSLLEPRDRSMIFESFERLLAEGSTLTEFDADLNVITPRGTRKIVAKRTVVDRDSEGRVLALRGTIQDITERKVIEQALRERTETLERANAYLERFNRAAVGRELRMIELKKEVNRLFGELGRPPRHIVEGTVQSEEQ